MATERPKQLQWIFGGLVAFGGYMVCKGVPIWAAAAVVAAGTGGALVGAWLDKVIG